MTLSTSLHVTTGISEILAVLALLTPILSLAVLLFITPRHVCCNYNQCNGLSGPLLGKSRFTSSIHKKEHPRSSPTPYYQRLLTRMRLT